MQLLGKELNLKQTTSVNVGAILSRPSMVFGMVSALVTFIVFTLVLLLTNTQKPDTSSEILLVDNERKEKTEGDLECPVEWADINVNIDAGPRSYTDAKIQMYSMKKELGAQFRAGAVSLDSVKEVFTENLLNTIIPYWYGTTWSFEGHTAIPNKGEIACGYLISTTLKDMGLMLNRYKLAQKGPLDEALTIGCGSVVTTLVTKNTEDALESIDLLVKEGIYFIGFDAGHVGYLVKRKEGLYLIHSNYLHPGEVQIECLEESRVFQSFSVFHIVDISNNEFLLVRWLNSLPFSDCFPK